VPGLAHIGLMLLAVALFADRGSRFLRDWLPILLALLAHRLGGEFTQQVGLPVHWTPQIEAEKILGLGTLPTLWLQQQLAGVASNALAIFSALMYLSHYFVPLFIGFLLWLRRDKAFANLMLGILAVTALAELTFLVAPTAPPWLAADRGLLRRSSRTHSGARRPTAERSRRPQGTRRATTSSPPYRRCTSRGPSCLLVLRRRRFPAWAQALQGALLAGAVFSVVYSREHYVVDVLAGALYALAALWLVERVLGARRI
jgi:hypothetical protein